MRNTKLKEIVIQHGYRNPPREVVEVVGSFDNVLCDVSTIQSIYSSNHTLEDIKLHYSDRRSNRTVVDAVLSQLTQGCLDLNKNANKREAIRNKIFQYYFVGNSNSM
jgi:hypothetical protein